MNKGIKIRGRVKVNGIEVSNQIVNQGVAALMRSLSSGIPVEITNMFILSGLPRGVDYRSTQFSGVLSYQTSESLVGNIAIASPTPDLLIIPSLTPPFSIRCTGTLPADKANLNPIKDSAALILNGDKFQSVSSGTKLYTPKVGNPEILLAVVAFPEIYKTTLEPFVLEWELFFEN